MRTPIGLDTETHLIGPGRLAPRLVVASIHSPAGVDLLLRRDAIDVFEVLLTSCLEGSTEIVGVNLAYDLAVFASEEPRLLSRIFEVLDARAVFDCAIFERLRSAALGRLDYDPELRGKPSFSLAELALRYLGRDRSAEKKSPDAWRLRYAELEDVPLDRWPPEARSYCEDDARDPVLIREAQLRTVGGELPLFRESVRHAFALHLMSARGVRTDGAEVERLRVRLTAIVDAATPRLVSAGLLRKDGTEYTTETRSRVRAALGEAAPLTDTGIELAKLAPLTPAERLRYTSTSAEVLELCEGDEVLALWHDVKRDRKELSDFVPKLREGARYGINARFNPIVASFRTSCDHPNLQQQPRRPGVRECFVPRHGYLWASIDYHVAELCSLAQVLLDLFGASAMADELRAGRDLHLVFAAELAGCTYEEAVLRSKAKNARIKELRQAAKAANFGIPGGLGAPALARYAKGYGVILSEREAVELRERWLARFPEMRQYFKAIAKRAGGVDRHLRTGYLRGDLGFTDACNHNFQHLTAAGAKEALYRVSRECYTRPESPLFGSYPVIFIHDEIMLEVPESRAHEAALVAASIMVNTMNEYTPGVPARAEPALMRRWYKGAEPVYREGRLVPWEPPA